MDFDSQRLLFDIPEDICYLNTAHLAPSFKAVENAGIEAVMQKSRPYVIPPSDFFEPVTELKKKFAKIIEADDNERIVTIPSVSYGIATITKNIRLTEGDTVILLQDQFPSNYYSWQKLTEKYGATLKIIPAPDTMGNQGELWTQSVLDAIDNHTAVVAMGQIHWANGTLFNLKAIREKTRKHNAMLIIDGSQSIGALPFSVKTIQPDALICAGYKWLFGPFGCGYAYFGAYFDQGEPLEENWTNRKESDTTHDISHYQNDYKPMANRYLMGESGSFIHVKMQLAALEQVLLWPPETLQKYCHSIAQKAVNELRRLGCDFADDQNRSHHLFGFKLPPAVDLKQLKKALRSQKVYLSFRGSYVRVSCHFFNTEKDFEKLVDCLKSVVYNDEFIDIIDLNGNHTGKSCRKSEIHSQGYYHNTAHVWFYTKAGQILLAQRAASKKICPLLWDVSVAGHVDAGETVEQAAVRETFEEVGIQITEESLEKIGVFNCFQSYPNGIHDNEFHHTFISEIDYKTEDLVLDQKEVAQIKFVSIAEFKQLLKNSSDNNHFVASNTPYYLEIISSIEKRLSNV